MNLDFDHIWDSSVFQKKLNTLAKELSIPVSEAHKSAKKALAELYSEQHPLMELVGIYLSEYILGRAYDSTIDVNPGEFKNLAKIMRRHPVAFVMTHKTYIDMFVLGVALARHGLKIPYIFGGLNMAFLGLGQLGRRAGAIFIRRSFRDDEIYKMCLRHFISTLVDDNQHFMWALEGTRSRTGKLVWPKMGILKYILEAERQSTEEVKYIPVSIVYDLIPDVDDMIKEGRGKNKSSESITWFINYVRKMGGDFGKISLRLGDPVAYDQDKNAYVPTDEETEQRHTISAFAFELVHGINRVTPVTTASLITTALLSKFALTKRALENFVIELMFLIENHSPDRLVDRGRNLSQQIQIALNLLTKSNIIKLIGSGTRARYSIVPEQFLSANYYANMAVHHLYHRAFIELAIVRVIRSGESNSLLRFWKEIMQLRDMFKFEFFYSAKATFSDEIEREMSYLDPDWESKLVDGGAALSGMISSQNVIIAQVVLNNFIEAYKVVARSLKKLDHDRSYTEAQLLQTCLFYGEEMHWKGQIHRIESVSKPFIQNGIRLAQNRQLIPEKKNLKLKAIDRWLAELEDLTKDILYLQKEELEIESKPLDQFLVKDRKIPGSKTTDLVQMVVEGESGPHIAAFFDLDRTLIDGFSAKAFFKARALSGKMTSKEILSQFSGAMVYAAGNKNFAGLAAIGAKGVKGIKEKLFIDVGEEVYLKHIASSIYPEARALVEAHMAKGHTVAIVSAATPYQVTPVARDLGIDHIMCTRMEVVKGAFTGKIIEPACWGEGKAHAGRELAERLKLDLEKSHFYTDSAEDLPLLDIVGHPHPVNPDQKLTMIAFENNWPIYRFNDEEKPGASNIIRTGLAMGSMVPAVISGITSGAYNLSWKDGVNSTISVLGDVGLTVSGIKLVVKDEAHLWIERPAVFIFNHQSNVDLLIAAKLLRKDAVGIAKKELQYSPLGPFLKAVGMIFIDRKNKEKAIEALKPAVDALKSGISVGIAPEGTRSSDYTIGKFKKGAFHMAMQAGVPVVPMIFKNAYDAMPRNAQVIKPAVIEVKILKPVDTKDWTTDNLDEHIKFIRNQYLRELNQYEE